MKHAILILCQDNISFLNRWLDYIDEDFQLYVHIDKKSKSNLNRAKKEYPMIKFFTKFSIHWGGLNILKAQLYLMMKCLNDQIKYDYFHLASESDLPLANVGDFKKFFIANESKSFIEYHPYPFEKWEHGSFSRIGRYGFYDLLNYRTKFGYTIINYIYKIQSKVGLSRKLPMQYERLYGGSNWMSLHRICIHELLNEYHNNTSFFNRLKYTFAPDEIYIHTVLLNSKYQKLIVNDNKRYIVWSGGASPKNLKGEDFQYALFSGCLFCRKISEASNIFIDAVSRWMHSGFIHSNGVNLILCKGYYFNLFFADRLRKFCEFIEAERVIEFHPSVNLYSSYISLYGYKTLGLYNHKDCNEFDNQLNKYNNNLKIQSIFDFVKPNCKIDLMIINDSIHKYGLQMLLKTKSRYLILNVSNLEIQNNDITKLLTECGYVHNIFISDYYFRIENHHIICMELKES